MDELLARIEKKAAVAPEAGRKAIGVVLSYLDRNAPPHRMAEIYAALPGAEALVANRRGGVFGMLGGGLMGAYAQLTATGLSPGQMKAAGEELLAFAREKVGADAVDEIAASVPALRQFL